MQDSLVAARLKRFLNPMSMMPEQTEVGTAESTHQRRHRKKTRHRKRLLKKIVVVTLVLSAWLAALWFWHVLVQDSPPRP